VEDGRIIKKDYYFGFKEAVTEGKTEVVRYLLDNPKTRSKLSKADFFTGDYSKDSEIIGLISEAKLKGN
jgi:hypothetical protein